MGAQMRLDDFIAELDRDPLSKRLSDRCAFIRIDDSGTCSGPIGHECGEPENHASKIHKCELCGIDWVGDRFSH